MTMRIIKSSKQLIKFLKDGGDIKTIIHVLEPNTVIIKTKRGYEARYGDDKTLKNHIKHKSDIIAKSNNLLYDSKNKKVVKATVKNIQNITTAKEYSRQQRITGGVAHLEDQLKGFKRIRYTVQTKNLKELYLNAKHKLGLQKTFGQLILTYVSKSTGEFRRITIDINYMDTYEEFKARLDKITSGNLAGSDAVSDDDYALLDDVYSILTMKINKGKGVAEKILFDCYNCENGGKCWIKVFEIISDVFSHDIKEIDEMRLREDMIKASKFVNFIKIIKKIGGVAVLSNTFTLKKDPYDIFENREIVKFMSVRHGVEIPNKLVKLTSDDIEKVYLYTTPDKLKHTVIYDAINEHYDVLREDKLADIYLSQKCEIFKKVDDTFLYLFDANQINTTNKTTEMMPLNVFFDYEAVIDFNSDRCFKPYSISWAVFSDDDLTNLARFDKNKNYDKLKKLVNGKVFNEVGYDCGETFIKWLLENQADYAYGNEFFPSVRFDLISFNGSNFDNILLLRDLLTYTKDEITVSDVFYNGNSLLGLKINNRHSVFDVAKHLTGSLKSLCESFKVNCVAKGSFDHHKAQKLHEKGLLIETIKNDLELIEYNNNDVLSLAVIYQRYADSLCQNEYSAEFGKHLADHKTIGGIIWKIAKKYWSSLLIEQSEEGKRVKKPVSFPKLSYTQYSDVLKYKCAGRVEMFNGIQNVKEEVVSLDECSMYPYTMAIMKGAYFPCGELVETDIEISDKIGFYYCDINQSNLKGNNLPNIYPEKVYVKDVLIENDWGTNKTLENYCISTVMIAQLRKYGCDVVVKNGFYFTDKVRGCDLFKFILGFMQMKNEQDGYKLSKPALYNSALRETLKLMMNSMSGKVIEGLHCDKTEVVDENKFLKLQQNKNVESITCINIVGNKVYASYKKFEEPLIKKQRPIYLGVLIYDYSKCYIYDTAYSVIGLDRLLYTDTDACKFRKIDLERDDVKKALAEYVPYWDDVLKYDKRYENFSLYSKDKVFGSYEDEFKALNPDIFHCFQKKAWVAYNNDAYMKCIEDGVDTDGTYKMSFKGVPKNNILINGDEDFITKKIKKGEEVLIINDAIKANDYYNTSNRKIKNCLPEFCEKLHKEKSIYVLGVNFRRVVKNPKRNVGIVDVADFNKLHNTIQCVGVIKRIMIK